MPASVDGIIERHQGKRTALISILHEIQDLYHHLPEKALKKVALRLDMDLNDIYGVATFYKSFSLTPRGKHSVTLCLGTACHVRGGARILGQMKKALGVEPGGTTRDGQFFLQVVNCLGVCAVGPAMVVDGKIYGEMNPAKALRLMQRLGKKNNGGRA